MLSSKTRQKIKIYHKNDVKIGEKRTDASVSARFMMGHLAQNKQKKCLSVGVELKNVGFAPLYKEPKTRMVLQDEEDKETFVYPVTQSIRGLAGGNEAEKTQILDVDIPFHELMIVRLSLDPLKFN